MTDKPLPLDDTKVTQAAVKILDMAIEVIIDRYSFKDNAEMKLIIAEAVYEGFSIGANFIKELANAIQQEANERLS